MSDRMNTNLLTITTKLFTVSYSLNKYQSDGLYFYRKMKAKSAFGYAIYYWTVERQTSHSKSPQQCTDLPQLNIPSVDSAYRNEKKKKLGV